MTKNNPFLKKVSTTSPAGHANPNHFVEKKERILPPAAIICDADNSGAEVHGN